MKIKVFSLMVLSLILFCAIPGLSQARQIYMVPDGTRIQASLETLLSTKTSRQGDRFTARVNEPVLLNGKEVIPANTIIEGRVAEVKQPGRSRSRAEMNLAYERIIFPNGVSETIVATQADLDDSQKEELDRKEGTIKGESTNKRDAAEIAGGTGAGAAIGAIAGGGQGAAIGAGIGGVIGLVDSLRRKGKEVELPAGTRIIVRLERPLTITSTK